MIQADSVHSTPRTNTSKIDPPVNPTRRRLLTVAAGGAVAAAIPTAVLAAAPAVDPVFDLIDVHRKAEAAHLAAIDELRRFEERGDSDHDWITEKPCHDEFEAFDKLVAAVATTLPGIFAKVDYLREIAEREPWMLDGREKHLGARAVMNEEHARIIRIRKARSAPKATTETRVALVAFMRGISDEELEQFYYVNRKGAKQRHFDHHEFAKKYGISIDWLWDGDLRSHPRGLKRQPQRRTNSEAMKQKREMREAIRGRIKDFAAARDLSAEDIKPAMTTKHFELAQFAEKDSVSIEWLITGKGRIAKTSAEQS